jgi:hypothetical protein
MALFSLSQKHQGPIIGLRVEKLPVACFGGRPSRKQNFAFRITEGSKLEPACSILANGSFFNRQSGYGNRMLTFTLVYCSRLCGHSIH